MYELIPSKTNKTAARLVALLFLGAAAVLLCTVLAPAVPFRWVFQLIAVLMLTVGVFLTTRYLTKLFFYRISEDGDLTVTEAAANGKRQITVCRVAVAGVRELCLPESPDQVSALKKRLRKEKIKLYDYTVDYRPAQSMFVIVKEGQDTLCIRLSYDKTLSELLTP